MESHLPKTIENDIDGYIFQPQPWMCQISCIKNLLITMKKHHPTCPSPTINKLDRVTDSKNGFIQNYATVTYLINKKILDKTPFTIYEKSNSNKNEIISLLDDENVSPVMISVNSQKYFEILCRKYKKHEIGYKLEGEQKFDHVLIIFQISEDVIFFDPFTPFLHLPGGNTPAKAIFKLPYMVLESLWTEALMSSRWIMWIEKHNSPQKNLDNYIISLEEKNGRKKH